MVDIQFLEQEINTLIVLRDKALSARDSYAREYEQCLGAIEAFQRLVRYLKNQPEAVPETNLVSEEIEPAPV